MVGEPVRHVSEEEYDRIQRELEKARELKEADTSRMTLLEKIEHQRRIKYHIKNAQ